MSRRSFSLPGRLALLGAAGALVLGIVVPSVQALPPPGAGFVDPFTSTGLADLDTRTGSIVPTAAQVARVDALNATARWNRFGTPQSLTNHDGDLGPAATSATVNHVAAARSWLEANRALFGRAGTSGWAGRLELVNDQGLGDRAGHAVLFRQRFGTLSAGIDGLVTVGIARDAVQYVSSSIAQTAATPRAATLDAAAAWRLAADNVGRAVDAGAVGEVTEQPRTGWTVFAVEGFNQVQRARLRAVPLVNGVNGTVRPAYEVNVVDVAGGGATAYTSFVDAVSGAVLVRHNQVDNLRPTSEYSEPFAGVMTATACGPRHQFEVDAATQSIAVVASAVLPTNDIVLKLYGPSGDVVASQDTGTSPEALTYSPGTGVPEGTYEVEVCPFADAVFLEPGNYTGVFTASEQSTGSEVPYPPVWDYFVANPVLDGAGTTNDNRRTGCWVNEVDGAPVAGCEDPPSPLNNLAARLPWDVDARAQTPTFTTDGNAASTAEAWLSPLTPGGLFQRPIEPDRTYQPPFEDIWNNERCNPATLVPGGNDILAVVTSLFSSHNRMHDYSYFLGFTEANYNLQKNNFGLTGPTRAQDPEIGNAQAGALTDPASGLSRNNANQITLQDGIPGITNQYLFQPQAGAFYAPCADGDLDMSIIGHEYTHAISNRMVAGPDAGLVGHQAGAMGESWSDQVASEFLFAHDYDTGAASPFVVGPYATGNSVTGIRNYAMYDSPLQFGDIGYDMTGPQVHADGEIWSATNYDVRQALIRKHNRQFPASDMALQRDCAEGDTAQEPPQPPPSATQCPGNRRWIQLMFDAFLLQQSATSMLDARDAFLAADDMRFNNRNTSVIWNAFAKRGMGELASTSSTQDTQPVSDYTSPTSPEGTLVFSATAMDVPGQPDIENAKLYVGEYEARATPIADTDPATPLGDTVKMVPGRYDFVMQADGYGLRRFDRTIRADQTIRRPLHLVTNVASVTSGGAVDGASVGSVNAEQLIDDTEASNWAGINPAGASVDLANPFVNIDLAGDGPRAVRAVRSVGVSALLRPLDPENPDDPDAQPGSRFTALRQFGIETCTQSATSDCSSVLPGDTPGSPYTRIFTSVEDAFDSTAPRPLAPDLLFQTFDVKDTQATHVRLVALENQCTGAPEYAGDQDDDPLNVTDCKAGSTRDDSVRAAELQVFEFDRSTLPPGDPVVTMVGTGPPTAGPGTDVNYKFTYTNLGPKPSADAQITHVLPAGVQFVTAGNGGTYNGVTREVKWDLDTVAVNFTGAVTLRVKMPLIEGVVVSTAQFTGKLTHSAPAAVVTVVAD